MEKRRFDAIQDLDPKIYEFYQEISEYMKEIDNKIVDMVQSHEKDFLVAFRAIMGQVNEEMQKLRDISDEQALMAKRNNALNDLKSALNWFQVEAVKLSEACSEIQEKYEIHKQKIHALETENIHLEKLVKTYSEENEALKVQFYSINEPVRESFHKDEEISQETFIGNSFKEICDFYNVYDPELINTIQKYIDEKEESMQKVREHKKFVREKQRQKLMKIKNKNEKASLEPGELEKIFGQCVKKITSEAAKRRSKQITWKHQDSEKFNLTAADKRDILEEFITSAKVYSILSERLFPEGV